MCSKSCFGVCWGVWLVLLSISTLSTPWFYYLTTNKVTFGDNCTVFRMRGWFQDYCSYSGDCGAGTVLNCPSNHNWRDDCAGNCSNQVRVMDTTLGLSIVAMILALSSSIFFCVRGCGKIQQEKSVPHIVITSLGSIFALVAVSYYAGQWPAALKSDGLCTGSPVSELCSSLFGSYSTVAVDINWGAIGWSVGATLLICFLVAICASCMNMSNVAYVVVQQQYHYLPEGGAAYPVQQQPQYAQQNYGYQPSYGQQSGYVPPAAGAPTTGYNQY